MKSLEDRILSEGKALSDSVLKVNSFINHMVDPKLMHEIGDTFAAYYKDSSITKVVTIEVSGIAPAVYTAEALGVPLVILKKQTSKTLSGDVLQTNITSFTKGTSYELTLERAYVSPEDHVLIIDDFLANGEAATGAACLVQEAGASIAGIGILIEKSFQRGRSRLEKNGYKVTSLVRVSKLAKGKIEFMQADI
ncbi:MAG: xanthine phosphoribosyltransferase [Lachnospiraceae bacterium]|jgi:xanthine phosphoribosyltransferase